MVAFQQDVLYSECKSTKSTQGGRHQKVGMSVLCDSDQFAVYSEVLSHIPGGVFAVCSSANSGINSTEFITAARSSPTYPATHPNRTCQCRVSSVRLLEIS